MTDSTECILYVVVYVVAYLVSTVVGETITRAALNCMRRDVKVWVRDDEPQALGTWLGCTERAVATSLVVWQSDLLPQFIGFWIAAKIAANWGKRNEFSPKTRAIFHLSALVGSAISFGVAILAGLYARYLTGLLAG